MVRRFAMALVAILLVSLLIHVHDHTVAPSGAVGSSCAICLMGGPSVVAAPPTVILEFPRLVAAKVALAAVTPHIPICQFFLTSSRPRDPPV